MGLRCRSAAARPQSSLLSGVGCAAVAPPQPAVALGAAMSHSCRAAAPAVRGGRGAGGPLFADGFHAKETRYPHCTLLESSAGCCGSDFVTLPEDYSHEYVFRYLYFVTEHEC